MITPIDTPSERDIAMAAIFRFLSKHSDDFVVGFAESLYEQTDSDEPRLRIAPPTRRQRDRRQTVTT